MVLLLLLFFYYKQLYIVFDNKIKTLCIILDKGNKTSNITANKKSMFREHTIL